MIQKMKAGVINLIGFVVGLVFLFGLIKWAQANPAQWQELVNNVVNTVISVITAILNAVASSLPASSGSG
jgi:hypothetical protein